MQGRRDFLAKAGVALLGAPVRLVRGEETAADRNAWVAQVLQRMLSVRKGMTRKALLAVFQEEGGISTALEQTFVSQNCPYFKVHVHFAAVGRPERDADGRETMVRDSQDVITSISEPFLQYSIGD